MRRTHFGKLHPVLAIVLVVATLAASAGAGILYQYINGNELEIFSKPESEDEPESKGGRVGLSMPALPPPPDNKPPERTEPFKYVYSDMASTTSESGAADSTPTYSSDALSAEEFDAGYRAFMLKAVNHFRNVNADKDAQLIGQAEKLLTDTINAAADPKALRDRVDPMLLDPTVARDPFFQYVAGMIMVQDGEAMAAYQLFNSSIVDHQKWDYPSCFVVSAFNERLKNGMDPKVNRDGYERHADAIVGWLQYDFSEAPDEQCFSWAILGDSIDLLAKEGQLDQIKKVIDKNSDQNFVAPWLAEMMLAHYHRQLAIAGTDAKENLSQARQHLQAALKINPAFTVAQTDLEAVDAQIEEAETK